MSNWLQRVRKALANPPKGSGPDGTETEFQQRARKLLQSESGAQTLKDLLLANKPEPGSLASAHRRKQWQLQLDHVQLVLYAFDAERSVVEADKARDDARVQLSGEEGAARKLLEDLEARHSALKAEHALLQGRLAALERTAADTEHALRAEHEQRVAALRERLADAVGADDTTTAEAVAAELSAELRQEGERRASDARAPQATALQADALRGTCERKAADLAEVDRQLKACQATLCRVRMERATIDYHEGIARVMLGFAQAYAESQRWRLEPGMLGPDTERRLDRMSYEYAITRPEFVPIGSRLQPHQWDAARRWVNPRVVSAYLSPLFVSGVEISVFERDTTRPWPEELERERQEQAESVAADD
ncbi:MAG: hypothetical protein O9321_18250 [Rubrivivax sp.]|jgi:hypothetical protein|nr:hypothetical protein [Rubrivivax sp.]